MPYADGRPRSLIGFQIERFESLIMPEPNTGCWFWLGSIDRGGYGKYGHRGRLAHQIAFELYKGQPAPKGRFQQIHHKCENTLCVNPDHLEVVTSRFQAAYHKLGERKRKTHCKNGHVLEGNNLYYSKNRRTCKTCRRERERLYIRVRRPRHV